VSGADTAGSGYTPNELARVLRVSPDKIRNWIRTGQLGAVNTATAACGKPRWVVLPHHLAAFERSRQAGPQRKTTPRRRQQPHFIDYYPD
jgi:hypothetical protein